MLIPYPADSISCIHGQLSCMISTIYATPLRDRGDAVSLRYRNRTEITVLMSVPAEALWFPRRRKSYKVRCRVKIALVSSSRVPFQEGLNGVVAWRLNVSNFDGWRLNFRLFGGWRLTPMTLSFRAEIKPKSCPDGSPLEQLNLSFRRRGSPYCSCDSPPGGSRACKPTRQTHCVIIPRWCLDQLTNHNNRQKQSPTQTTNKRSSIKQEVWRFTSEWIAKR